MKYCLISEEFSKGVPPQALISGQKCSRVPVLLRVPFNHVALSLLTLLIRAYLCPRKMVRPTGVPFRRSPEVVNLCLSSISNNISVQGKAVIVFSPTLSTDVWQGPRWLRLPGMSLHSSVDLLSSSEAVSCSFLVVFFLRLNGVLSACLFSMK